MPKITDAQIAGYAKNAGFSGDALIKAVAIALGESGGNTEAHNDNALTGDNSYGLWQINMLGSLGPARRRQFGLQSNNELFNPATNARAAYAISSQGRNFTPWSVYSSGMYLRYLSRARTAARNADTAGTGAEASQAGLDIPGFGDVFSWPGEIMDFFEFITDPNTWLRLGMILGGSGMVLFALFQMGSQSSGLGKKLEMITNVIPQTKGIKAAAAAKGANAASTAAKAV